MQLIEFDGKSLLARHGIAVPKATLLEPNAAVPRVSADVVVKAQILEGKRGKNGLILSAAPDAVDSTVRTLRGKLEARGAEPLLMVESKADIAAEYYAAIRIDDVRQQAVIMFSSQGGVDVENSPERIVNLPVSPLVDIAPHQLVPLMRSAQVPAAHWGGLIRFLTQLHRVFSLEDAEFIEINPLAVTTDGAVLALDAKIELDDSAAFRHPERAQLPSARLRSSKTTALEARAANDQITLVELEGSIALLTAGAGLGMAVVDHLADHGLHPANFVDAPGGGGLEKKIEYVLEVAKHERVEAVAVYVLQSAQPLSRAIGSLLKALDQQPLSKPIVVGLVAAAAGERGMSVAQARELLGAKGIVVVSELEDLVTEMKSAMRRSASR